MTFQFLSALILSKIAVEEMVKNLRDVTGCTLILFESCCKETDSFQ